MKAAFSFLAKGIGKIYNIRIWRSILYMSRPKSNNVQVNISIPAEWKFELENLARIYSVEEGRTVTFLDLMRRGIKEKYQLGEPDARDQ